MPPPCIRPFRAGEELTLREVFYASVHGLACRNYSAEQLAAWAPVEYDREKWSARIRQNQPFVAEEHGQILGFADVQPDGYIDQLFVAPQAAGQGVGSALLQAIEARAREQGIARLHSQVSLTAQSLFLRHGFEIEAEQTVIVTDVELRNARMFKRLR
ncbi:MAG: GNAT family N-acetyltransferase [Pirellulaceae bacterium]|jgi:putative acetyltransferase|nr:GNAT family N-acetyltransferase [Pirellulaceae bacterium]